MTEDVTTLKQHRSFGGTQGVYRHPSSATRCAMEFAVYVPPQAAHGKVPVLYWLSGLTCTWANFTEKAGAQRYAAEHGLLIVAPDTSPRGVDLPGENDADDFGSGAGFYVDATEEPWAADEAQSLAVDDRRGRARIVGEARPAPARRGDLLEGRHAYAAGAPP